MKLYLAGPMTGLPEFNRNAFDEAAAELRALGHAVFSPVDYAIQTGFVFDGTAGSSADAAVQGFNRRAALAAELSWICQEANAVIVLPGWESSTGCAAETAAAHAVAIPVWAYNDFLRHGSHLPGVAS